MASIKNVALAGAAGSLGSEVLKKLRAAGDFTVTILRRHKSSVTFPSDIRVIDVDYTSVEELTSALKGQDAVVSTVGAIDVESNRPLIDAAFAAGVKRIIPSEYALDLNKPEPRKLPVYRTKVYLRDHVTEKSKNSSTSYTFVCTLAFLDWGIERNFFYDGVRHKFTIFGTGDQEFSAITLASIGDAIVGVLRNLDETKNRTVFVDNVKLTQNKLLAMAKKASPTPEWEVSHGDLDRLIAIADQRVAQGLFDMETFIPYLYKGTYDKGMSSAHERTDNELLGVKSMTNEEVFDIVKRYTK